MTIKTFPVTNQIEFDRCFWQIAFVKNNLPLLEVVCHFFSRSDLTRVIHADAGKWIAIGAHDKKVRFIHSESGKQVGPVISGHAGTVRTVAINQAEGYVLSGSYDTSIR